MPSDASDEVIISAPAGYWFNVAEYVGDRDAPTDLFFLRSPIIAWVIRGERLVHAITIEPVKSLYGSAIELPDGLLIDDSGQIYESFDDWKGDVKKSFAEDNEDF